MNLFLAEERLRLGLKAKTVAEHAGVAVPTQSNYEQNKRFPDTEYLRKIAELGFDVNFVITGERNDIPLTPNEKELLQLYRQAPESVQHYILKGLKPNKSNDINDVYPPSSGTNVSGNSVTIAGDNQNSNVGNINTGNMCTGDMYVNESLPCKNGDAYLSADDYANMPYCNKCITKMRQSNQDSYHIRALFVGGVFVLIYFAFLFFTKDLPTFMDFYLQPTNDLQYTINEILSTAVVASVIMFLSAFIGITLANKENSKIYPYHS